MTRFGRSRSDAALRACVLVALVSLAWAGLGAAMPTFWTVATQADFLKGDVEDLSIDSDGRVFLGPSTSLVAETAAPFLWTVVSSADGTLWAGTGNEGKVLKVGKDGKVATFFDATELEVHAIVPAPNNGLYVATSPDGKIYQVSADGTARTSLRPRGQVHLGARPRPCGQPFRRHRRQGRHLQDHSRRQGHALLQDELHKRRLARLLRFRRSPGGNRITGASLPDRRHRQGVRPPRFAVQGNPCAPAG